MGRKRHSIRVITVGPDYHKQKLIRTSENYVDLEIPEDPKDPNNKNVKLTRYTMHYFYEFKINDFLAFLRWIFTGIIKSFVLVIDENGDPFEETPPEISGKVLKVAKEWKGLDKAIKSAFMKDGDLPRWIIIIVIIIAIAVLALLIKSGWIPLPEGFLQ